MNRLLALVLLASLGCGDDGGESSVDAAAGAADAGPDGGGQGELAGAYARVVPGYATEAECRAANPDELFACVELVSLCAGGEALILFTDIVFDGAWVADGERATVTFEIWDAAFSDDGTTVFERQPDGSIHSDEVYGDRPFAPSADDGDSLCP